MTSEQLEQVEAARAKAEVLYIGEVTGHRSCGVAVAETFGCNPKPYATLRRGGLTGEHTCGAVRAGEMVLSEIFAPEDPAAPLPEALKAAIIEFRELCHSRLASGLTGIFICNELVAPYGDFQQPERKAYCTSIAATVAATVAEVAIRNGYDVRVSPLPEA